MLWIETPTNPLLKYVDVEQASKIAHKYGLTVVVDNTFLTPYFQVRNSLSGDVKIYELSSRTNIP